MIGPLREVYLINSGKLIRIGEIISSTHFLFSPVGAYPDDIYYHDSSDTYIWGLRRPPYAKNVIALPKNEKVLDCIVNSDKNKIIIITASLCFTISRDGTEELNPCRVGWWINRGHEAFGGCGECVSQHTRCSIFKSHQGLKKLCFQDDAYHYRVKGSHAWALESYSDTPPGTRPKNIVVSLPDDIQLRKEIYLSLDEQVLFLRDELTNTWMVHRSDGSFASSRHHYG